MRSLIASLLAVLAAGCASPLDAPGAPTPLTVTRLRSEAGSFTYFSEIRQSERLVIRDRASWIDAWVSIWPALAPIPALPNVDFSREMIVLVALGERPMGGYTILVDSAGRNATDVTVWVGTSISGHGCAAIQALTQPVDIARLPRIDAPVRFAETSRVHDCQ